MNKILVGLFFFCRSLVSLANTDNIDVITLQEPLLIRFGYASEQARTLIKNAISGHYYGKYVFADADFGNNSPIQYGDFHYDLSINVIKINSMAGKFMGVYILTDKTSHLQLKWTFFSDQQDVYAVAFFSKLNLVASDSTLGYIDIFNKNLNIKSNLPDPTYLDTISTPAKSIGDAINATFSITSKSGLGSGFFIDSKYAITNYHVTGELKTIDGIDNNGDTLEFSVINRDPGNDLSLLKANKKYASPSHLQLGFILDSSAIGQEVFAIGCPGTIELINTVSTGIISGIRTFDDLEIMQIDAPVNPGNSGGPLIDKDGNLLGIVTAKIVDIGAEGIAFVIKSDQIIRSFNIMKPESSDD